MRAAVNSPRTTYEPSLDGLRAVAVALVFAFHCKVPGFSGGFFGVDVFFVLSGFLITYLLLKERDLGPVNIPNFYVRRVLRIWPLYFLIVLIGFFVAPSLGVLAVPHHQVDVMAQFPGNFLLFVTMLANVAFAFMITVPFANVLWSVAVEEQFYLFWPHLVGKARNILRALLMALGAFMVVKLLTVTFLVNQPDPLASGTYTLVDRTRFSCMMIGGLAAYAAHARWGRFMRVVFHTGVQWALWIAMGVMVLSKGDGIAYRFLGHEATAVLTALLLLNLAFNKHTLLRLDGPLMDRLGKVSYGIYVYHLFMVVLCIKGFRPLYDAFPEQALLLDAALLLGTLLVTVVISWISYHFFELWFLRKKKAFSAIISGDQVR